MYIMYLYTCIFGCQIVLLRIDHEALFVLHMHCKDTTVEWHVFRLCESLQSYPQYAIMTGGVKRSNPPLTPISVERVFQIIEVDVVELPKAKQRNKYAVVFQDYLLKWPSVFATPDQKVIALAKLLMEAVIPVVGIPEALLSDQGTSLIISHLI